ncbi:MAG TPA: VCBS repeat-containing protein [Anaeromyxobacteraceae bacterium]|nr:VCBS repeat-containing protein [Anaeromyxobacteraceae bacterium]
MAKPSTVRRALPGAAGGLLLSLVAACYSSSSGGTGYVTQSVAVADLNGDGNLDIVGANAASVPQQSFLSSRIQIGSMQGSFEHPVRTATGLQPVAIAVGDLNGDGLPDVAVADHMATGASYFVDVQFQVPGSPGLFSAPLQLSLGGQQPTDLALADLNGDGKLDVAVAASGEGALQVFFQGPGAGVFEPATSFPVGDEPTAVAASDLMGSGHLDLVVVTRTGKASVLLHGAVPGTFLSPVAYAAGTSPAGVQVADMNGDGHPDILVADYAGALLVLLQSSAGDGTFQAAVSYSTQDYGSCSLAVADLNGDGKPDVAVANAGPSGQPGSLAVFLQDPSTPGVLNPPAIYPGYWGPLWVVIGDIDADGKPDLVVADGGPYIRYQSPTVPGTFLPPVWLFQ